MMERRRRFLVRELLRGCDLMIAAYALPERPSPDAAPRPPAPDSQETRGLRPPLPRGEDGGEGPSGVSMDSSVSVYWREPRFAVRSGPDQQLYKVVWSSASKWSVDSLAQGGSFLCNAKSKSGYRL